MNRFRIGNGYDAHRFAEGRPLILCGVEIPYERGLAGHSDADAAAHALTDALLGALALGDIGKMFPDSDEQFRGADSIGLLKQAFARPEFADWAISNIDMTIVAQRPKISPFRRHAGTDRVGARNHGGSGFHQRQNNGGHGILRTRRRHRSVCGGPARKKVRKVV